MVVINYTSYLGIIKFLTKFLSSKIRKLKQQRIYSHSSKYSIKENYKAIKIRVESKSWIPYQEFHVTGSSPDSVSHLFLLMVFRNSFWNTEDQTGKFKITYNT